MTAEQSRAEESRLQAHCLGSKKKSPIAPERLRKCSFLIAPERLRKCSFWFLGEESKELRRGRWTDRLYKRQLDPYFIL